MKVKANFEELRDAVVSIGKTAKKNPIIPPAIKLKAANGQFSLSITGCSTVDARISMPCEVTEPGVFVTGFSEINLLSVRKCSGDVFITSHDQKGLLLKYRGSKANTILSPMDIAVNDMPAWGKAAQKTVLPLDILKRMSREVIGFTENNTSANLHAVKLTIADDEEEGIAKVQMIGCDGKSIAIRTAYAARNGDYSGSVILLPEDFKTALDLINDNEGNVEIVIDAGKLFLSHGTTLVCLNTLSRPFPNVEAIAATRSMDFTVSMDKAEFLETLNCAIYLQSEAKAKDGVEGSVMVQFSDHEVVVRSEGLSSYSEQLDAETEGELPGVMLFNTRLLKTMASICPSDTLALGGLSAKSPLWMCCGENNEYVYCVLPRIKG